LVGFVNDADQRKILPKMGVVSPVSISLNDKHRLCRDATQVNTLMLRLGTTNASLKLKGIDAEL